MTGDITVLPSYTGALELPNLLRVGGSVIVWGDAVEYSDIWHGITALRLPNLTSIGDELFVYLTQCLAETDFRSLRSVGYRVYYMRNLGLRRVGLDSFEQGAVEIAASPLVAVCELDAICMRVGIPICGQQYSNEDCTCATRCGRLEPHC